MVGAIDDEISTAEAPTYNVESVCDIGNMEVDDRMAGARESKRLVRLWNSLGMAETFAVWSSNKWSV